MCQCYSQLSLLRFELDLFSSWYEFETCIRGNKHPGQSTRLVIYELYIDRQRLKMGILEENIAHASFNVTNLYTLGNSLCGGI